MIKPLSFLLLGWLALNASAQLPDSLIIPPPGAATLGARSANDTAFHETVKLSAQGAFSLNAPRVGDSLDYVLRVEWEDTQVPVMVLPPDSLEFPGFKVLGQAASHRKMASSRGVRNQTEFVYRLRAESQGSGKATSVKLRYLTGLSQREEAVFVPTALADIGPARVKVSDRLWFKILLALCLLAFSAALGWACFRFAARTRKAKAPPPEDNLRPETLALKNRLRAGDSRAVLLDMEALCVRHLRKRTRVEDKEQGRFESLLDAYLKRSENASDGAAGEWESLRELFRHARFAGGHKEPHELQEAYRILKKRLNITGEEDT